MEMSCILTALALAIISVLIGYYVGKSNKTSIKKEEENYKSDLEACKQRNSQLQNDIDSLRLQLNKTSKQQSNSEPIQSIVSTTVSTSFNAANAKAIFGKKIKENDLKIIEGIGPKIEELFKTSGILTWKSLSETSVDRCNEILDKAGDRFRIHDPGTWPRQSKLAYEGKWEELKKWQDSLDKGKEK